MIERLENERHWQISDEVASAKGLFFVCLYGAYEHTVHICVHEALQLISALGCPYRQFRPGMLGVALDAECQALAQVGQNKTWEKRHQVFERAASEASATLDSTSLLLGSGNLKYAQLELLWKALCVDGPVLPRPQIRGKIDDLVEKRNAVAHGRESSVAVGRRYTPIDLLAFHTATSELCTHFIDSVENCVRQRDFLTLP